MRSSLSSIPGIFTFTVIMVLAAYYLESDSVADWEIIKFKNKISDIRDPIRMMNSLMDVLQLTIFVQGDSRLLSW